HCSFYGENCAFISSPASSGDPVIHIPKQHGFQSSVRIIASIQQHSETSIDYFSPTNTASIVNRNPGCPTETVSDHVVNRHICRKSGTVINIGSFSIRRVRS